ncbi:MAG: nuclear transport factor 2 family protein [Myxococcota bacterium]|jgi:uncharacterized protein (TIGR02246 family)|nr:nuclear transport factor 2 family protein [Myxococcota bacterium]
MSRTSMEMWELVARESIRDLVARYNASGDAGRLGPMMALFAEDAVVEFVGHGHFRGRDEIRGLFSGATGGSVEPPTMIQHHVSSHVIDVLTPTTAKGRSYFAVFTAEGADHWGRYVDEYREEDGRWLFASRKIKVVGQVPGGWGDRASRRLSQ